MKSRPPDPRKLDVAAAAADATVLEGHWPLAGFDRLAEGFAQDGDVAWSVRGQLKPVPGGKAEVWLHLGAQASIWRECQRCLQPVALDVEVLRALRFVADEATAAALDAESEDDVLVASRKLDLHAVVEDELLLALPLVPKHDHCPSSAATGGDPAAPEPAAKPFAALAALKRGRKV